MSYESRLAHKHLELRRGLVLAYKVFTIGFLDQVNTSMGQSWTGPNDLGLVQKKDGPVLARYDFIVWLLDQANSSLGPVLGLAYKFLTLLIHIAFIGLR